MVAVIAHLGKCRTAGMLAASDFVGDIAPPARPDLRSRHPRPSPDMPQSPAPLASARAIEVEHSRRGIGNSRQNYLLPPFTVDQLQQTRSSLLATVRE
jgi:hypothetical protein